MFLKTYNVTIGSINNEVKYVHFCTSVKKLEVTKNLRAENHNKEMKNI